ncbi:unnamed protein product [Paramecium octaurelia]|uniref:Uncharacterized protein n=1 Tax=Paramecium octaurelia TaxID=43137 RepID=A0A8S1XU10_PAROT|nr:unnamed protein product [Paramecium octaurelia]
MISYKVTLLLFLFCIQTKGIDLCNENETFESCIQSDYDKCKWDGIRKLCERTFDFQQGCSITLNRKACIRQIGNVIGQPAKCRFFLSVCEDIPNLETEKCENNLSKSGCISITNPEHICYWKDDSCHVLAQNQWNKVQEDFDQVQYSVSACSKIENYLIIHSNLLWDLISYTPDLLAEANNSFKKEMGLEVTDDIIFDDPNTVSLQNNYQFSNGSFAWYTIRESKEITLTNLQKSYRYRYGCVAIEIENDSDYLNLLTITDEQRGVNHLYCKYLSRNPNIADDYVFSDGLCKKFNNLDLNNIQKTVELNLSCKSLDHQQCIYFDSIAHVCRLKGIGYEYPCVVQEDDYVADCENAQCTVKQCSKLIFHYLDMETNTCRDTCSQFPLSSQSACEAVKGCKFLGTSYRIMEKSCSPQDGCDHLGIEKMYCIFLKDQCGWDELYQRCYRIKDEEFKLMKCSQAFNAQSCVLITLSDQICFWNSSILKCQNVLEQPILIYQAALMDIERVSPFLLTLTQVSNENFCKYQQSLPSEYIPSEGKCYLIQSQMKSTDITHMNMNACLKYNPGLRRWDSLTQQCIDILEVEIKQLDCVTQVFITEKVCQKSKVSQSGYLCIYDQQSSSCKELEYSQIQSFGCIGYGFTKEVCVSLDRPGVYCKFQAGICEEITETEINSVRCSSLQNVTSQVCKLYTQSQTVCLYDKSINSCYTPSVYFKITYQSNMNRYGCQLVQDTLTYFDIVKNECISFSEDEDILLSNLDCSSNYVNQKTCLLITKSGQNCHWDTTENKCKNYSGIFSNCGDEDNFTSRICQALSSDVLKQLVNDNYCTFLDNKCQTKSTTLTDCGESEKMNILRCSGLTGLNQAGEYIQMCAFIDLKCTSLIDDSMDAFIVLNRISCSQANLKACSKVQTNGKYCQITDYVSSNNFIIDKKCVQIDNDNQSCQTITTNFQKDQINPNHCIRANDSCYYDQSTGCQSPNNDDLECDTPGLSYQGCILNTNNHRCAFNNSKCQYFSTYSTISNCKYLNQLACSYYQYQDCYWNGSMCDISYDYGSDYSCILNEDNLFMVSNGSACIQEEEQNYQLYTCDSKINQFGCGSIPNQYCEFIQNQCQFYSSTQCEDSGASCNLNNSLNLKCVLKDGKCFHFPHNNHQCDFFDKTNYEFCLQYSDCVYVDQKCEQIHQIRPYWYCFQLTKLECIIQNKQYSCKWENEQCIDSDDSTCPSLQGFRSYYTCSQFNNCLYGYTKSGLGFCYQDVNFQSLTCEQLDETLCLEDMAHINSSLLCYWDQSCKNINNTEVIQCEDLQNFQSSYPACASLDQEHCMYSFIDKKCKLTQEYGQITTCQGTTSKQCSQIKNTCYFNGSKCQTKGAPSQLNKYGCIIQSGTWKFTYFTCYKLNNEMQSSCINLSKEACLGDLTKEISCQWIKQKCINLFEDQNKKLLSCQNLNQRACLNVSLSNIQCIWNETIKSCDSLTITNNDCSLNNLDPLMSISVCASSTTKNCVRHYDKTKCAEINVKLDGCNLFGLNKLACISLTKAPCSWIQVGDGGYCNDANIYTALCEDFLNQSACLKIQTLGQVCKWEESTQQCINYNFTTCESANNEHSIMACKGVTEEACEYDPLKKSCNQIQFIPNFCSSNFNSQACIISTEVCLWQSNSCDYRSNLSCLNYNTKIKCLQSNEQNCQWINNKCQYFYPLAIKVYCYKLPTNINNFACMINSIDPCFFDSNFMQCIADQSSITAKYNWSTIITILALQQPGQQSSILNGKCEELQNSNYCLKSRIPNTSCIWNGSCQEVTEFDNLSCLDSLNIWGCLNITNDNQYCFWKGQKCLNWNSSLGIMENVNKNVCIQYSINSVYEQNSCIEKQIESIQCTSDGISQKTCLSIPNKQCQWITSCIEFTQTTQTKCQDYKNVTYYVCQMIPDLACSYDYQKHNCIEISKEIIGFGVSKSSCVSNKNIATFWNSKGCQELYNFIDCDTSLVVNELACRKYVKNTACLYDSNTNRCKSNFNKQSLQCKTLGLNLLGCIKVEQEPCIFKDNKCQVFTETSQICMFINLVNFKACASVINQQCSYDSINFKCQSPLINENYCNVSGVNKDACEVNTICMWNQDDLDCKCKSDQKVETCQYSNITQCRSNSKCYFDLDIYRCIKKQCYHLKEHECTAIMDNKTCYLSKNNGCQPATKCEDIIDSKQSCSTIYIDSQPCIQAGVSCISINNYISYCPQSDCSNSNCIIKYGACKMRTCDDYTEQECQSIQGCYLDQENTCQQLLRCSQITQEIYGDQVTNICNKSSVNGLICNWQRYSLLDDTVVCTNQYCEIYGSSTTLCQGNEVNGYSCVLFNQLVCKQCEYITEPCFCNQQKNVCIYQNGKCNSVLCSNYLTKDTCSQVSDRCYWSTSTEDNKQIGLCLKSCEKIIDAIECNSRFNECYFEISNGLCVQGQKQIPNLSSEIVIEEFYAIIIQGYIFVFFIVFT